MTFIECKQLIQISSKERSLQLFLSVLSFDRVNNNKITIFEIFKFQNFLSFSKNFKVKTTFDSILKNWFHFG